MLEFVQSIGFNSQMLCGSWGGPHKSINQFCCQFVFLISNTELYSNKSVKMLIPVQCEVLATNVFCRFRILISLRYWWRISEPKMLSSILHFSKWQTSLGNSSP